MCVSVNVEGGPVGDTIGRSPEMTRALSPDEFERKECDCLWQILGAA